jgi:hypothetical protein
MGDFEKKGRGNRDRKPGRARLVSTVTREPGGLFFGLTRKIAQIPV